MCHAAFRSQALLHVARMATVFLLLSVFASAALSACSGSISTGTVFDQTITVRESDSWVDVTAAIPNDRLTVTCTESITPFNGIGSPGLTPPTGSVNHDLGDTSNYPIQGVFKWAVVGRISNGTPFFVGTSFDHTLVSRSTTGTLRLRTNDDHPGDGSGQFQCHVVIQRFTQAPLTTTFTGNATISIDDPNHQGFGGPFTQPVTFHATFDGSRTLLELTDFPTIMVGPFPTPVGADSVTVTLKDIFGAFGPYGPFGPYSNSSGTVPGLPLTLHFVNSISLAGKCDAPLTLTTGSSTSPGGVFPATGSPEAGGAMTLVGTSRFVCDTAINPTSNKDLVVQVAGMFSPSPAP